MLLVITKNFVFHLIFLLTLIYFNVYSNDIFYNGHELFNNHKNQKSNSTKLSLENKKLPDWMIDNIYHEFQNFTPFSVEELEKIYNEYPERIIHFRIREGILYYRCNNDATVHPVSNCVFFFVNLLNQPGFHIETGDFLILPWDTAYKQKTKLPILCFSKHCESNYISIPDWYSFSEECIQLMQEIDRASIEIPWHIKKNKGFFIGAANGILDSIETLKCNNRAQLVFFSLAHPNLVWARFNSLKNQAHICPEVSAMDHFLGRQPRISEFNACKYKYLIDVDGWGCAFHRCQWILRSTSVPIKENSNNVQWYYSGLKPYVHYIPYETNCSNLKEIITWLTNNDEKAKTIAITSKDFAIEYLDIETNYLYLYHVLKTYNSLNRNILNN